ncbi:MAG TPA: hypothetical protein VI565_06120 [Burkholderiales bacterium]|nr:hypothetical protein [Burkholderiales bacterium]
MGNRWYSILVCGIICLGISSAASGQTPGIAGGSQADLRMELSTLKEATISARLTVTGDLAKFFRQSADANRDGTVNETEGAKLAEGLRGAFGQSDPAKGPQLDGKVFSTAVPNVTHEALLGDSNSTVTLSFVLTFRSTLQGDPNASPDHALVVTSAANATSPQSNLSTGNFTLRVPPGFVVTHVSAGEAQGACEAKGPLVPGTRIEVTFRETAGACAAASGGRGLFGLPGVEAAGAFLLAAAVAIATRRR